MSDAIRFMLAFSYSLVLFIFLIWLITRENLKSLTRIHYAFFFGLVIMSVMAITYVINPKFSFNNNNDIPAKTKPAQVSPAKRQDLKGSTPKK